MKKPLIALIILSLLGISVLFLISKQDSIGAVPMMGASENGAQWQMVTAFKGFVTNYDATKIDDGANSNGQNTTIHEGDRLSVRDLGYDTYPDTATYVTTSNPIVSTHTFRKRGGEQIMMRAYSTYVEYFEEGNDTWEVLISTSTSADYGFTDFNINTDLISYTYFGNAADAYSRWTGAHTLTSQAIVAGTTTVHVDSTASFPATGNLTFCGTTTAYSAKSTTTFTITAAPDDCAIDKGVAQAVQEYPTYPRGNIYLLANNRIFLAGITTTTLQENPKQLVYFSKYGDPTSWLLTLVASNTADAAGVFNLGEGGGGVTAMAQDESAIYIFKNSIIYRVILSDSLYGLTTLKAFDGKSQTQGATNQRCTFASGNGIFFITPDNQIMYLTRVQTIDYPQVLPISDDIKPTTDGIDFSSCSGIVYKDKAYFTVKKSSDSAVNDTVLVYNLKNKTWDSPIVGWNVADWMIYKYGTADHLFFGDALTPNVVEVNTTPLDYVYNVTANWRSKQFNFGLPQSLKYMDNVFVEGWIAQNTVLTITLLLDEDGFTHTYSTTLNGASDTQYIYNSSLYNVFGLTYFGYERFGTNADLSGKKKFRVYLGKDFQQVPFYNAQIDFASDGENQQWEVTNFGFRVVPLPVGEKRELYKSFR